MQFESEPSFFCCPDQFEAMPPTTGGGLRYCHPGMFGIFLLVEAVRQLRGECGKRQVANARTALAHGFGGVLAGNATVILGRES